ncbi:MFS transporter [Paludibacterium purpuratum]|uniref:Putative MFS family arabinose efflux permease n=1 Tax=Paludibacterium purpuratum TaxID=1144873 RepID=A0A4V3DVZ8_9NEIS|nr:MFS transporter [Paludibacterium purpuratum]TDR82919.1 putative MFS family arabinose efflux permease [Paludibacterium purpuratum]
MSLVTERAPLAMTPAQRGRGILPLACLVVFMAQMATTVYLPSLPEVARDLALRQSQVELSISLFVLAAALPLLFWGRAADAYGRRAPLLGSLALFLLSSLGLAFCTTLTQLLCLRVVQGMAAGGATIVGRILVRDYWQGNELARRLSLLSMAFICALGGGQFVGGLIARYAHWPLGFGLMALVALLALGLTLAVPIEPVATAKADAGWHAVRCLLARRRYVLPACVGGLGYAVLVTLQESSPFVFRHDFSLGAAAFGSLGLLFALSYLAGSLRVHRQALRLGAPRLLVRGALQVGLAGLAIWLLMGVWHAPGLVGLLLFVLLYGLAVFGQAVLFPNSMALAVDEGRDQGGMAMALCGFLQQMLAGAAGMLALVLPHGAGWAVAVCCLGLATWWLARLAVK